MQLPIRGKRKQLSDANRCVQHYYRPAKSKCSVCGSPLCEECMGTGSVAVCKRCFDDPLSEQERAAAETTGQVTRKARLAHKPITKKGTRSKTAAPTARRKPPRSLKTYTSKIRIRASQVQSIKYLAAGLLLAVAAALVTMSLLHKSPFGVVRPTMTADARQKQVKGFVFMAVNRIELFKKKHGKLPESLNQVGITDTTSWKYQVISGDQYLVEVNYEGQTFSYNSNQSIESAFPGLRAY